MARQSIKISVTADTSKFRSELSKIGAADGGFGKLKASLSSLGTGMKIAAGSAVTLGAAAAIGIGKQAVEAASKLQQSMGAIDDIFKSSAKEAHTYAKNAARAVGLSRNAYNELASLIGAQLKNGGTAAKELAAQTNSVIKIGADLSAQFGGSTKDAVEALSAALKGERDPIEKYGISLTQSAIDAEAAALGYKKVNGQLSVQAQQAATLSLIQKQSADSTGKFARETDTLAHKQQVLTARWEDAKAKLGDLLIPVVSKVVDLITQYVIPAFERLGPILQGVGSVIGGVFVGAWQALVSIVQGAAAAIQWVWEGLKVAFTTGAAVIQGAWTAVASVISAVAAVIRGVWAGLQAGIQVLIAVFQGLWAAVRAVWSGIGAVISAVAATVRAIFSGLGAAISGLINWFSTLWSRVASAMSSMANAVSSGIASIINWFRALPGKIVSAFGNAGKILWNVGKKIITGLWDGMKSVFGKIKDGLGWLTDKLTSWKGPYNRDKTLLVGAGQAIIGGLITGMESRYGAVRATLGGLTRGLPGMLGTGSLATAGGPPLPAPAWANVSRETRPVHITVQTLTADQRAGQAVADAIREYERSTGRSLLH